MAKLKMDPFTRQVAKGMQDFGFRRIKKKGNDQKWRYVGTKAPKEINYTLQNKAKEKSRAGILRGLRDTLRAHGVKEHDILWVDKFTLGLIAIEDGDEKDDLERKLLEAITSITALEAAKLAFELGLRAGREGGSYESTAIAVRQAEFDDKLKRHELVTKIQRHCHRRFIGIMEQKLEEVIEISFDPSNVFLPNPPTFSKQLVDIFGLLPWDFAFNDDDEQISVFGEFKGSVGKFLRKHGLTDRFIVYSDTIDTSGVYTLNTPAIFDYFDMPALHNITTDVAHALLTEIEKTQANVELNIKGKYRV